MPLDRGIRPPGITPPRWAWPRVIRRVGTPEIGSLFTEGERSVKRPGLGVFLSCGYGDGGSSLGSDAGPGSVQEGIVGSKHGERNSQEQWLPGREESSWGVSAALRLLVEFPRRSGREEDTDTTEGFLLHFNTDGNSSTTGNSSGTGKSSCGKWRT
ncbi:hypothetical protein EYF80_023810 [Liparis tanakae]|uniref:Uncharacterized protein n=1 Tax=Liparis tanakae TaxID=230148 RepID=A0A4Z2HJI5_9TELE|nr:hypothetical protein EYF80_023810 [Liparis tanakae]